MRAPRIARNLSTSLIASLLAITALAGCLVWPGIAAGEKVESGGLLPWFGAGLFPSKLPRSHRVPIELLLEYSPEDKRAAVQSLSFDLSRQIAIRTEGFASCPMSDLIGSAKTAKRRCANSLVGHGEVKSEGPPLPGQPEGPVERKLLAFYSRTGKQRYILAQVTSMAPIPLAFVIPFRIEEASGSYSLDLSVVPMQILGARPYHLTAAYSRIWGLSLSLKRVFGQGGGRVGFLSADCPAPPGYPSLAFPFVKASLTYTVEGGTAQSLSDTETRLCAVAH